MCQLEDLFIKEAHRGVGQGKRLFGELGAVAKERGCSRVEWKVLKVTFFLDWNRISFAMCKSSSAKGYMTKEEDHGADQQWNQPSIDFYTKCLKAVEQSEWEWMRIEGSDGIERLTGLRKE